MIKQSFYLNKMQKYSVQEFNDDMQKVVKLIEDHNDDEARSYFNAVVYQKYSDIQGSDSDNPLSIVILFFFDLDEYLNNEGARTLGVTSREYIIGSFYSDYRDALTEALVFEQKIKSKLR